MSKQQTCRRTNLVWVAALVIIACNACSNREEQSSPDQSTNRNAAAGESHWEIVAREMNWVSIPGVKTFQENNTVSAILPPISNRNVLVTAVSPVCAVVSTNFAAETQVRLSGWNSVSLITLGIHLDNGDVVYQGRKSHPTQNKWLELNVTTANRLRLVADNPTCPLPTWPSNRVDYVRVYVMGIPSYSSRLDILAVPPDIVEPKSSEVLVAFERIFNSCVGTNASEIVKYFKKTSADLIKDGLSEESSLRGVALLESNEYTTQVHPTFVFSEDPTWLEDPFEDVNWRLRYHGFDWLNQLTAAWSDTGSADYLNKAVHLVEDWANDMLGVMPCDPIVWCDHSVPLRLERLINLFEAYRTVDMTPDTTVFLLRLIYAHALFCYDEDFYGRNQPTRIHNHAFFQDRALLRTALRLHEFRQAREWELRATQRIVTQMECGLTAEGIWKENTSGYHIGMFRHVKNLNALWKRHNRAQVLKQTERDMLSFILAITRADGVIAGFGDNSRHGIRPRFETMQPDAEFVFSKGEAGEIPKWTDWAFPESGYVTMRDRWWPRNEFHMGVHTLFLSGFNSVTHKHRDDLSFAISGYGEDWLIDPGLYSTDESDPLQLYARSARGHNTVSIDDCDFPIEQSRVGSSRIAEYISEKSFVYVEAVTKAYSNVDFRRKLIYIKPNVWVVQDTLKSLDKMSHSFTQNFHFSPDKKVDVTDGVLSVISASGAKMRVFNLDGLAEPNLHKGEKGPQAQGWFFPVYGKAVPCVCASYTHAGEQATLTKLILLTGEDPLAREFKGEAGGGLRGMLESELPREILGRLDMISAFTNNDPQ